MRVFRGVEFGESQKDLLRACAREEIDINVPFEELPKADQNFVIEGERRSGEYTDEDYEHDRWYGVRGFFRWLESKTYKMHVRVLLSRYRAYVTCPKCDGGRYQPEALNYKIVAAVPDRRNGARTAPLQLTLPQFQALSISDARDLLRTIECSPNDKTAQMLRDEICARLNYLCEVGVGYLTLDRSTRTLSGGEVQRVNLTTCLGASLANTLFVMDEPSIGLHPRDVGRLVRVMHNLRDKGNTLLVVEHEEQIIRAADNLIDIGPGRGEHGGELVWNGSLSNFASAMVNVAPQSLTRDYLNESQINSSPEVAAKIDFVDQDPRRATAQLEKYRRRAAARRLHVCNWSVWVRQIHSDSRCALSESAARQGTILQIQEAGRMQIDHRRASNRRCGDGRSVTACSHAAFNSDSLSRFVTIKSANCSPRNRKRWRRD